VELETRKSTKDHRPETQHPTDAKEILPVAHPCEDMSRIAATFASSQFRSQGSQKNSRILAGLNNASDSSFRFAFTKDLNDEEQRHFRENISEEELVVFDILTRPGPDLTPMETDSIKKVCKDLLARLKTEKLVLAWRTKRTTRAAVQVEIEKMLDAGLPEKNTTELFEQKRGVLFQHVLEKYPESGESVYEAAG
jgi:hypothetical protein